jgi:hypothetical protein
VRRVDNLTTLMCRLSCNVGASTSWNPVGLSRPVMGLLTVVSSNVSHKTFTVYEFPRFTSGIPSVRHWVSLLDTRSANSLTAFKLALCDF